jgi:hypothetical protein
MSSISRRSLAIAPRRVGKADILDLSFVADLRKRRCFWRVKSTGNGRDDGKLGQRLALEYLAFEEADKGGAGNLQLIVRDMPRKLGLIEISFLQVSYAASAGAYRARQVVAYWDSCEQAEAVQS